MPVLRNIGVLARCLPGGPQSELHLVEQAALAWQGDRIVWVGPEGDLPDRFRQVPEQDAGGRLVIPGLVDCHTHLVFGGWRALEFEQRIRGDSYLEIAARGGGIASTVASTRAATSDELQARATRHLAEMGRLGVTTVEAKSGYGLTVHDEIRLLEVIGALGSGTQRVVPTLLAAHVVPPEFRGRRGEYISLVIQEIIPQAAARSLARFCDVFVEESAFSGAEGRAILLAGLEHGLRPKLHADQLTDGGGAALAAELGAVSADHLEHTSESGIHAMAAAGVVAVSLPFATLYLGAPPMPARRFMAAGVAVAVATDFNPGTAPSFHLPVALTLACTLQKMTPAEALKGATIIAARAIGLEGECGSIEVGKSADFAIIDAASVTEWLYHLRANACLRAVAKGRDL